MRITFVCKNASFDGGTRVVATYAERLMRRGHDVLVVSLPAERWSAPRKLRWLVTKGEWPIGPRLHGSHLHATGVPHKVIDAHRPITADDLPDADAIIATWWETAEWVNAMPPKKGRKLYFIQHHEVHMGSPAERVDATWRLPLQKIVISQWLEDLARERFGDVGVIRVPNSVDTGLFHAPPRGRQRQPTVGLLYSTAHFKGLDISLPAIARLKEKLPELRLIAFGHGQVSDQLPLPEWAEFHPSPAQDRIRELYALCDVWLCGSRAEGFHLPPLEAMACRCPVVSTRVGGPQDIVRDGYNGFLVDLGDSGGLAARLADVLNLPDDRWLAMSNAALQTAVDYTWDDATDRFEEALRTTVDARRGVTA